MSLTEVRELFESMEEGDSLRVSVKVIDLLGDSNLKHFVNHRMDAGVNCTYVSKEREYLFVKGKINIFAMEE